MRVKRAEFQDGKQPEEGATENLAAPSVLHFHSPSFDDSRGIRLLKVRCQLTHERLGLGGSPTSGIHGSPFLSWVITKMKASNSSFSPDPAGTLRKIRHYRAGSHVCA